MNLLNPSESKVGAYIFIVLACLMFLSSFVVINSPAPALIVSFLLLSIIVMLMGFQRLNRTKMHSLKFSKVIKTLSSLTVFTSCTAIILNSAMG
ncbi:hypothetical protein GAB14E_2620 [Colwellia psychrerythraea]|uniref:Uncharacterized protein n=1 Tax=Colwellia psychrerythraea TaxID=28229 RepID=A0A099KT60_COLPS|nr:hypothetical protein GAB14E_2620 [Colwellia psychrerythraea]